MVSAEAIEGKAMPLSFLETTTTGGDEGEPSGISPPTILVHGLDSSSHTWRGVLDDLGATGLTAVAVDQRGCGESPLGDPKLFSPDALVDDLYAFVSSHSFFCGGKPFVLVGHSMGGRVAMSFAAKHPERIAALVIEDMDVRTRSLSESRVRSKDRDATLAFDRNLPGISTPEGVVEAYRREGYPSSQVQKWLSEGRVTGGDDGGYHSQVNPAFRLLCYEQFFETNHGEDTWNQLAAGGSTEHKYPIHVMIADPTMTICDEESVSLMKNAMKENPLLEVHRYPGATHSIHNTVKEEFMNDLKGIIEEAQKH